MPSASPELQVARAARSPGRRRLRPERTSSSTRTSSQPPAAAAFSRPRRWTSRLGRSSSRSRGATRTYPTSRLTLRNCTLTRLSCKNAKAVCVRPTRARRSPAVSDTVNVAIIGVGNCASSLVQGVEYYRDADPDEFVPGLMHVELGGYHVRDVRFTAAFDIDARKVGRDLSEAVFSPPNNTIKLADVPRLGVPV